MKYAFASILFILFATHTNVFGQPTSDCTTNGPMFISAQQPAVFQGSLQQYFEYELKELFHGSKGAVQLQILIDTNGNACCMNMSNNSSGISGSKIKQVVRKMPAWKPARQNNLSIIYSALIHIIFSRNTLEVIYINQNPPNGTPAKNTNTTNNPAIFKDQQKNTIWKLWNFENSMIPSNLSRSVAMESSGTVWYCTDRGLVRITNDGKWEIFSGLNVPALAGKNNNTWTTGLAIDNSNSVWVESFDHIVKFDGTQWIKFDTSNSPVRLVQKICPDRNGLIWFCTFQGLIQYDGKNWKTYNTSNSKIASNNVKDVFVGNDETIWIATDKGINKVMNNNWSLLNNENSNIPENDANVIKEDKEGNIWAGLGNNKNTYLIKIDRKNTMSVYQTGVIWDITVDDSNKVIWLATNGKGLVSFNGKTFTYYNNSNSMIPDNTVSRILIDKNGDKWISTFGGLVYTNTK